MKICSLLSFSHHQWQDRSKALSWEVCLTPVWSTPRPGWSVKSPLLLRCCTSVPPSNLSRSKCGFPNWPMTNASWSSLCKDLYFVSCCNTCTPTRCQYARWATICLSYNGKQKLSPLTVLHPHFSPVFLCRKASVVVPDQCVFLPSPQPISRQLLKIVFDDQQKRHEPQLWVPNNIFKNCRETGIFMCGRLWGVQRMVRKNRKHLVDARGQTCFGMRVRQHSLKWELFTSEVRRKQTREAGGWRWHRPQWVLSAKLKKN